VVALIAQVVEVNHPHYRKSHHDHSLQALHSRWHALLAVMILQKPIDQHLQMLTQLQMVVSVCALGVGPLLLLWTCACAAIVSRP
jgi:hypothetical protein